MGKTQYSLTFLYKNILRIAFVSLFAANAIAAQTPQRIHSEISDYSRFALAGNVRPAIVHSQDQGAVSGATAMPPMALHFAMTPSQSADLGQLLRLQQTRHSTQFHQWLTPEQYADKFGLNAKDIEKVTIWLESMGFSNVASARSRTFITFNGTAAQAQAAFHTSIHRYMRNGEAHIANATAPELPAALTGMVAGVRGLHDFHPRPKIRPHFTSSVSGNHYLTPDDFATIYDIQPLYGNGITGATRTIVIPGQTDILLSDIEAFQTASGLPVHDPQVILTGPDPGTNITEGDLGETDLDIEWAGGIAKGANIVYINSTDILQYSVPYAIDNNVGDVLPITYGACESGFGSAEMTMLNSLFQQAAAQGMTVIAAAGDQGAADCDGSTSTTIKSATQGLAVDFPGSSPYVTALGGTSFNEGTGSYWNTTNNTYGGSAVSYIPEVVWDETSATNGIEATGGGASIIYPKPSWQVGTGVPADGARDVPDIALDSSPDVDGFLYCTNGFCTNGYRTTDQTLDVSGGTSAASPSFAAIVALLDQQTGSRQGSINQNLYLLASISSASSAFHDITSGNNIVPCTTGTPNCTTGTFGYSAGVGYDQVTGLGTIDAANMFEQWTADFALRASATSLTVAPGSSGTATISVNPFQNFNGTVSLTCSVSSALANTTCSVPGTVSGGSGTVTLTVMAAANATAPWRTPHFPAGNWAPLYLLGALLIAASIFAFTKRRKMPVLALAFSLLLVIGLSSCGGGNSSSTSTPTVVAATAPTETGTVTVSGTSGSLINTTTIAVTVN